VQAGQELLRIGRQLSAEAQQASAREELRNQELEFRRIEALVLEKPYPVNSWIPPAPSWNAPALPWPKPNRRPVIMRYALRGMGSFPVFASPTAITWHRVRR
jgi:hypothetical protein